MLIEHGKIFPEWNKALYTKLAGLGQYFAEANVARLRNAKNNRHTWLWLTSDNLLPWSLT
jgi:hypothetical protein